MSDSTNALLNKSRKELVSKKKLGQLRAQPTCKKNYNKDLKGGQKVNIRTKKEKFLLQLKKILLRQMKTTQEDYTKPLKIYPCKSWC